VIQVQDLVKNYGSHRAVRGISFHVQKGEVVGFLGPNGAGKTTTLRVLTGYHPATSGTALVAGLDVFRDSLAVRRRIGYLPETVPLYPDLRVVEFLRFRCKLKGLRGAAVRQSVEQAMELCGVTEVRRKLIAQISRGYRQRVGLADALVGRPDILILDEPTSGLDPNQRRKVKELVRELAKQHTILFSSHILAEVEAVSSRVLIIDRGRIRADGTPEALTGQSAEGRRFVAAAQAPADALVALLGGLPGAVAGTARVAATEDGTTGDGFTTVTVDLAAGADPRDAAWHRLSATGWPLRELRIQRPTLEDLFHQITNTPETEEGAA
jgi:ABC-2 type transport system ATP-binding protein